MNIKDVLRTLIGRFLLFLLSAVYFVPFLVFIMLPERLRYTHFVYWFVDFYYRCTIAFTMVPVTFKGKEHIPQEPVVFVGNHQSALDIPLLGVLARKKPHIWLARFELMDSIILRFILPYFAIVINVVSPKKAARALGRAIELAEENGKDIMIFPEGQRFTDGSVHTFFRGFVILARRMGRPIVPVRIFGVNKVYPPNTFLIHYHPVNVVIGPPMKIQEGETDEQFKDRVYKWFVCQQEE